MRTVTTALFIPDNGPYVVFTGRGIIHEMAEYARTFFADLDLIARGDEEMLAVFAKEWRMFGWFTETFEVPLPSLPRYKN